MKTAKKPKKLFKAKDTLTDITGKGIKPIKQPKPMKIPKMKVPK